ncbi:small membrane protein YohP [Teichococcus vastitatis]|uniref:hypothetical protein n=1 Tax=Teichococcus vastitatis TaxID=2307076 RepID=UPI0013902518|nr:hypothetical protein [Pseudoroseomonas vastitatis]
MPARAMLWRAAEAYCWNLSRTQGELMIGGLLKLFGGAVGLIFLIGLVVVIGLFALVF